MVILLPALLAVLFGIVQAGLYFHARNVALSAAQEGARAAAAYEADESEGVDVATAFATRAGGRNPRVTTSRTQTLTTVSVALDAPNLVPWLIDFGQVSQSATTPTERVER